MLSVLARALLVVCCSLVVACNNCCVTPPATLAPGALTQEQASAAALRQAPAGMTNPAVEYASVGQNPFISSGPPVWLVRLTGAASIPTCAPGYLDRAPSPTDPPCMDNQQGKEPNGLVVVLDPYTGAAIGWSH